jgi:hypothetical protein
MSPLESHGGSGVTYSQPTDNWQRRMDEKRLDAGQLGRLFGAGESAPSNIAGLAVLGGLTIGGLVSGALLFKSDSGASDVTEIWKYTAPIVTAALGYLFGKSRS